MLFNQYDTNYFKRVMVPKQIVYISSIPWDFSWHRQQEMMSKIAETGYEILFVQPCSKKEPFKYELQQKNNIWILSVIGLPFERCSYIINWLNSKFANLQIDLALKQIGFDNPIVWLDRVHGFDFNHFSRSSLSIYDLIDEITAFGRIRNNKMLIRLENKVLKEVDVLISSSQTLLKRKLQQSARNPDKYKLFIPNAVDIKRFTTNNNIWEPLSTLEHPIIGFVGEISARRLNYGLIHYLADRHKDWQFVFIGPHIPQDKRNLERENIAVYNPVHGEEIPSVINAFDVGIIPYNVDNNGMDYIFPRKACEYIACGKPVVSTPLGEIEILKPWCLVAHDYESFERCIMCSLTQSQSDVAKRKKFALSYDWDIFMSKLLSILQ